VPWFGPLPIGGSLGKLMPLLFGIVLKTTSGDGNPVEIKCGNMKN
jgi:hypothetical protein